MQVLLFFSRVAFICNICFLVAFLMHYIPFLGNGAVPSTIIILGNVLAIVINTLVNMAYGLVLVIRKPLFQMLSPWLILINFAFFLFQCILLVK